MKWHKDHRLSHSFTWTDTVSNLLHIFILSEHKLVNASISTNGINLSYGLNLRLLASEKSHLPMSKPNCLIALNADNVAVRSSTLVTRAISANITGPIPVPIPVITLCTQNAPIYL